MSWREAPALQTLLGQINALAPTRDKRSDGTKASAAHHKQNPTSDHEIDRAGLVCALDVTHGTYWGSPSLDVRPLVTQLATYWDNRLNYLIFERLINEGNGWRPYDGLSPHLEHFHASVKHGAPALDARAWALPIFGSPSTAEPPATPMPSTPGTPAEFTYEETEMLGYIRHPNGAIARVTAKELHVMSGPEWSADQLAFAQVHGRSIQPIQVKDDADWAKWSVGRAVS